MSIAARNVLLFTLVPDGVPLANIWNIFYHMYLDPESHSILVAQCKALLEASTNMKTWRASPYGAYLRFSTEYTLLEIRRHWDLYAAMPELPVSRQQAIRPAIVKEAEPTQVV